LMGDPAKNCGLGEETPPRLIEAYSADSASKSDSVSNDFTESEDTFPGFENAVIIDQRDVGVAEEAISSHLIAPGSESDADSDAGADADSDSAFKSYSNDGTVFFGGLNMAPAQNGVDSQRPVCFKTKVQFERADGDTVSWAAVVKKDCP